MTSRKYSLFRLFNKIISEMVLFIVAGFFSIGFYLVLLLTMDDPLVPIFLTGFATALMTNIITQVITFENIQSQMLEDLNLEISEASK